MLYIAFPSFCWEMHTLFICNETHDAENTFKITFQRKSHLTDFISQFLVLGISLSSGTKPPWPQTPSSESLNSCKSLQFTFPVCWQQKLLSNFSSHTHVSASLLQAPGWEFLSEQLLLLCTDLIINSLSYRDALWINELQCVNCVGVVAMEGTYKQPKWKTEGKDFWENQLI